jgi:hypothetical protein
MLAVGLAVGALAAAIAFDPAPDAPVRAGASASADASSTTLAAGPVPEGTAPGPAGEAAGGPAATVATDPGATTATTAADPCAAVQARAVQGVTPTTIRIGFAVPDLGVLAALVNVGDIKGFTRGILATYRAQGKLPICGRDIEPVFRTYDVLNPATSRAACVAFADQDKVFAVFSLFAFSAADCVTREKHLFLFDAGQSLTEPAYAASPLLFAAQPPIERQLRAYSSWLVQTGQIDGKKLGVYYVRTGPGGSAPPGRAVERNLIDELKRLGHPIAEVVATDGCGSFGCSDPNDSLAIQRFRSAGVQVVLLMNYKASIISTANQQGYRPHWALLGTAMASDATTGDVPPSFDGARGLLFEHVGEQAAGVPASAAEQRCSAFWRAAGGRPPGNRDVAEGQSLRQVCDQIEILTRALAAAGHNLDPAALARGMESIQALPMAYQSDLSFAPGKHYGSSTNLDVRWSKACSCWRSSGPFAPLYGR